jgi:hypothetical protein
MGHRDRVGAGLPEGATFSIASRDLLQTGLGVSSKTSYVLPLVPPQSTPEHTAIVPITEPWVGFLSKGAASRKQHWPGGHRSPIWPKFNPLPSCVTLDKSLAFSELQFPHPFPRLL